MAVLDPTLRDRLATVIGKENRNDGARAVAQAGARAAVEALAVHLAAPHAHMDEQARALRIRLRARARQLGDARHQDGRHEIGHLVEQCAYEHWHRMLFARFLAENDLLIHPGYRTAVTLEECAELAPAEGARDAWELAARYACGMLPQIFRADDPVLDVRLPPEHLHELERLLASLPAEVFTASDSLGWVYQFWQARRKKEVNASEKKIGADELPAVTQLFTEPYMVQFLLQNTLGAWWAGKVLASRPEVARAASTEDEMRRACSLPGFEWTYLRFVRNEEGTPWRPAAGTFDGWPKHARELKVLDPCCGSGHFLVAAFEILVAFRMQEEGLGPREACDAVLRDNLYGLEIDYRCVQIAAFALALAAWKYPGAGGWRVLPELQVACSGLAPRAKESDWLALANGDDRLTAGMKRLYQTFQQGPTLGSLINPRALGGDLLEAGFADLEPLLAQAAAREGTTEDQHEMAVAAQGLAKAAGILAGQFTLVATNVPYLGRGKQDEVLREYCESAYSESKADLATCFVERCFDFCAKGASMALVTPQNWLFLGTYKKLRKRILNEREFNVVASLGPHAFGTIPGEVVNVALVTMTADRRHDENTFAGLDASEASTPNDKADVLREGVTVAVGQKGQLQNPDMRILLGSLGSFAKLSEYAVVSEGLHTGDYPRFGRKHWELPCINQGWEPQQGGTEDEEGSGGCEHILFWQGADGELMNFVRTRLGSEVVTMWIKGAKVWGKRGVAIGTMRDLKHSLYHGVLFTHGIVAVVARDEQHATAILSYADSEDFRRSIRLLDQKVCVARAAVENVPFDLPHWQKVAAEKYPKGLPKPHSNDPTQWLFNGHPKDSDEPLQVAVARLLGYRWPRQTGSSFLDCPALGPDGLERFADADGIVCIPPVRGERPAADRLVDLLAAAYGKDWHPHVVTELLRQVGFEGRSLEDWLRNGFFEQHCKLFHHRPFIWHIWDGHREGFSALVNYHRLDRKNLESLTYTYLGDWIAMQDRASKAGEGGAGDRLAKARALQKKLELILEGEAPYDIFVRWKPIEKQPIGWEPDLNDGVRLNIRPFMTAGVLRWKPNIKWGKDRGKNPPGSPWGEVRNNDLHLTLAEKRKARGLQ